VPVPLGFGVLAAAALLLAGCGDGERNRAGANAVTVGPRPAANASGEAPPANAAVPAPVASLRIAPWSATGYAFNGTEPFWGGSVTGTTIRYMVPEDQFGDVVETDVAYAAESETYSGRYRGRPFVLTLARGACSDGMSDRTYAFNATLQVLGETRRGCADPQ
jgi:uncharacterized membrane protein